MDICEFIETKDTYDYCCRKDWNLNSLECAYLVWQSGCTIEEKHKAWREIIDRMPDMKITPEYQSLRQCLEAQIACDDNALGEFYAFQLGAAYQYSYLESQLADMDEYGSMYCNVNVLYSDYHSCKKAAIGEIAANHHEVVSIKMVKNRILTSWEQNGHRSEVLFSKTFTPLKITRYKNGEYEPCHTALEEAFESVSLCRIDKKSKIM